MLVLIIVVLLGALAFSQWKLNESQKLLRVHNDGSFLSKKLANGSWVLLDSKDIKGDFAEFVVLLLQNKQKPMHKVVLPVHRAHPDFMRFLTLKVGDELGFDYGHVDDLRSLPGGDEISQHLRINWTLRDRAPELRIH